MDKKYLEKVSIKIFVISLLIFILSLLNFIFGFSSFAINIALKLLQILLTFSLLIYGCIQSFKTRRFLIYLLAFLPFMYQVIQYLLFDEFFCINSPSCNDKHIDFLKSGILVLVITTILDIALFIIAKSRFRKS